MSKKLANIGVFVGALIALAAVVMAISGVESSEKGKVSIDVFFIVAGMVLWSESMAYRHRGMPTNVLPRSGTFVFASSSAVEYQIAKEMPDLRLVSLIVLLSPVDKKGEQGSTRTYRIRYKDILPSNSDSDDGLTREELFNAIKAAQPDDEIRFLSGGKMIFVKR